MVCESKLDKLAKPAGMSRDVFGGACQIHIAVLSQKNFSTSKKSPQIGYTKNGFFFILSKMKYTKKFVEILSLDFVIVDWPVRESFSVKVLRPKPHPHSHEKSNLDPQH